MRNPHLIHCLHDLKALKENSSFEPVHGPHIRNLCSEIERHLSDGNNADFTASVVLHSLVPWSAFPSNTSRIRQDLTDELYRLRNKQTPFTGANTNILFHKKEEAA